MLKKLRLMGHLAVGLILAGSVLLVPALGRNKEQLGSWWHRRLLRILGIRLRIRGTPFAGPRILASNHVSWLDIPVIGAVEGVRFVSKYEVKEWPLAGTLATTAGTLYIRRGAGGTKQLIGEMAQHLRSGTVVLFPEGTTTTGSLVLKFQPRLFGAAIESGVPVQPVALRYGRAANGEDIAPFVGEDDLVHNLLRLMREPVLDVELTYCEPIDSAGRDRAQLALAAHAAVCAFVAPSLVPNLPARVAETEAIAA